MDYNEILRQFSYESDKAIKDRIQNRDTNNILENKDIINQIVLWKLSRTVNLQEDTINKINTVSNTVKSTYDVNENSLVKELILDLLKSKGIRLPMASTILHFYCPDVFPILDQRAYRELIGNELGNSLDNNKNMMSYLNYINKCEEFRIKNCPEIEFRYIDKILYQLDKEKGNKVKY